MFVTSAPHHIKARSQIMKAFDLFLDLAIDLFPDSRVWVNGSFVTYQSDPPADIDVFVIVQPVAFARTMRSIDREVDAINQALRAGGEPPKAPTLTRFGSLFTQQSVSSDLGQFPRIQPFGGLVDAFFARANDPATLNTFHSLWQGEPPKYPEPKGYVEVKLR